MKMPRETRRKNFNQVDTRKRRNPGNEIDNKSKFQEPEDEDRFFVIEKLLDKRFTSAGREEYLVRWLNYPPEWDTWEPRIELEKNALDMINEFNRIPDNDNKDENNKLHCICRKPYKFDQGGMIQCLNCSGWYHFTCLNINMEEANAFARYYCPECRSTNRNLKNLLKINKQHLTFYD